MANQLAVQVTESGTATVTAANLPSAAALPSGMKVEWKLYLNNNQTNTPDESNEAGLLQNAKITSNGTSATITGVDFTTNDTNKDNVLWAVAKVVDSDGNDMGLPAGRGPCGRGSDRFQQHRPDRPGSEQREARYPGGLHDQRSIAV